MSLVHAIQALALDAILVSLAQPDSTSTAALASLVAVTVGLQGLLILQVALQTRAALAKLVTTAMARHAQFVLQTLTQLLVLLLLGARLAQLEQRGAPLVVQRKVIAVRAQ